MLREFVQFYYVSGHRSMCATVSLQTSRLAPSWQVQDGTKSEIGIKLTEKFSVKINALL